MSTSENRTLQDSEGNFIQRKRLTKARALRRKRHGATSADSLERGSSALVAAPMKATHGQRQAAFVSLLIQRKEEKP